MQQPRRASARLFGRVHGHSLRPYPSPFSQGLRASFSPDSDWQEIRIDLKEARALHLHKLFLSRAFCWRCLESLHDTSLSSLRRRTFSFLHPASKDRTFRVPVLFPQSIPTHFGHHRYTSSTDCMQVCRGFSSCPVPLVHHLFFEPPTTDLRVCTSLASHCTRVATSLLSSPRSFPFSLVHPPTALYHPSGTHPSRP